MTRSIARPSGGTLAERGGVSAMLTGRTRLVFLLLLVSFTPVRAQDPPAFQVRLLEILRAKGVLTPEQHTELLERGERQRRELLTEAALEVHIDEMVSRIAAEPVLTSHREGRGFRFETADKRFRLQVRGRLQVRFARRFVRNDPLTDGEDQPDFFVARARIALRGRAYWPWLKYKLQFDIAGNTAETRYPVGAEIEEFDSENRLTELRDAYVEVDRWDWFRIRVGQFKVPYSRQLMTSSARLQFVDRPITRRTFALGRDRGLMIYGDVGDDLFEYYAGVFDGDGDNVPNDDKGMLWAGRVAVNPFGPVPYAEGAIPEHREFVLALGFNAWLHQDDNHLGEGDDWAIGGDLAVFFRGFSLLAAVHYHEEDRGSSDERAIGWLVQLGYMVIEDRLEVALRAANIDWDNSKGDSAAREYLVGLNWYLSGHNLKLQWDFGRVEIHEHRHPDNEDEWRLRWQFQVVF